MTTREAVGVLRSRVSNTNHLLRFGKWAGKRGGEMKHDDTCYKCVAIIKLLSAYEEALYVLETLNNCGPMSREAMRAQGHASRIIAESKGE